MNAHVGGTAVGAVRTHISAISGVNPAVLRERGIMPVECVKHEGWLYVRCPFCGGWHSHGSSGGYGPHEKGCDMAGEFFLDPPYRVWGRWLSIIRPEPPWRPPKRLRPRSKLSRK